MKKHISEVTGWEGYVLISQQCVEKMGICPENAYHGVEKYEHFDVIHTTGINLEDEYNAYAENCRDYLEPGNADVNLEYSFTAPPAIIWDWLNDPVKRNLWAPEGVNWVAKDRPHGRTGPSSNNHCTNSNFIEHILDWRPFQYYTVCHTKGWLKIKMTGELLPVQKSTLLKWRLRIEGKFPRFILRQLSKIIVNKILQMNKSLDNIEQMTKAQLEKDNSTTQSKKETAQPMN